MVDLRLFLIFVLVPSLLAQLLTPSAFPGGIYDIAANHPSIGFILGDDGEEGIVYRTADSGKTWVPQTSLMPNASDVVPSIYDSSGVHTGVWTIAQDPADTNVVYFAGYGGYFWVTKNRGVSYTFHGAQSSTFEEFYDLYPHPTQSGTLVAEFYTACCSPLVTCSGCRLGLKLSQDFGETWNYILYTTLRDTHGIGGVSFTWANNGNMIFLQNDFTVSSLSPPWRGVLPVTKRSYASNMLPKIPNIVTLTTRSHLAIQFDVSNNSGETWSDVQLPVMNNSAINNFYILDSSHAGIVASVVREQYSPLEAIYVGGFDGDDLSVSIEGLIASSGPDFRETLLWIWLSPKYLGHEGRHGIPSPGPRGVISRAVYTSIK